MQPGGKTRLFCFVLFCFKDLQFCSYAAMFLPVTSPACHKFMDKSSENF